jgi:hypothetical protein
MTAAVSALTESVTGAESLAPHKDLHASSAACERPYIGILGVLIGSIISTLAGRLTHTSTPPCACLRGR